MAQKISLNVIMKQFTREMINNINPAVGFRLITKAGTTGIINVVRIVPVIGGVVNGTLDGLVTRSIAFAAKSAFQD